MAKNTPNPDQKTTARLTPHGTLKVTKLESYQSVTNGLLVKRADLFNEAERCRDRLAEIKNDVSALDRTLTTLGYEGELDAVMPRQKREVLFGQGELHRELMYALREQSQPVTARTLAREVISVRGDDPRDRKYLSEVVKRVSKCLRKARENGLVKGVPDTTGALLYDLTGPNTNNLSD